MKINGTLWIALAFAITAPTFIPTPAHAEKVWVKRRDGTMVRIERAKTFAECMRHGLELGYPRIGPGGQDDVRGAVGFCRSRGYSQ